MQQQAYKILSSVTRGKQRNAAQHASRYLDTLRALRIVNGNLPFTINDVNRAAITALACAGYIRPAGNHSTYCLTGAGYSATQ